MQERPIPDAALRDVDSVEMLRVWIAERKLHCSLKVGMYHETTKISEEDAWGTILADAAKHLANALHEGYGLSPSMSLQKICDKFVSEVGKSTSETTGGFV
jgi:Domain of unknown function (DUF5076)